MTHEYRQFFLSSQAAERAGDAEVALEYHRGIPMFTRSAHVAMLTQLAGLAGRSVATAAETRERLGLIRR